MNVKERDNIAYFICTVEEIGLSVKQIVNELSASDKKFHQVYEYWRETIAASAESVAEYHRRMTDEFGFDCNLIEKEKTEIRGAEILEEIKAQYNN